MTFADQVVVMQDGEIVQIGTPVELFDRPTHTFVGHFIGSPGMNILPCEVREGQAFFNGQHVPLEGPISSESGAAEIGVRPEYVQIGEGGIEAQITKVADVGHHFVVEARVGETKVKAIVIGDAPEQGATVTLGFQKTQTRLYRDGWIASQGAGAGV